MKLLKKNKLLLLSAIFLIILLLILVIILGDQNPNNKVFGFFVLASISLVFGIYLYFKRKELKKELKKTKSYLKDEKYRNKFFLVGSLFCVIALILLLVICITCFSSRDNLDDGYTPPEEITKLVDNLRLTEKAKKILYASSPQLKGKAAFNGICGNDGDPDAYVAGCYYKVDNNEYIDIYDAGADSSPTQTAYYNYDDSKRVTLSHEMLHAAYDRISDTDKSELEIMLDKVYSANKELREELNFYPDSEKYDELFARAATEIVSIPAELEEHYKMYFQDRKLIVKLYQESKKQIDEMLSQADNIMLESKNYESRLSSASSIYEYNTLLREYNRLVDVYNQYVGVFRDTIDKLDSEK